MTDSDRPADGLAWPSFAMPLHAVVIGASGGIGRALAAALAASPQVARVLACARRPLAPDHAKLQPQPLDLLDEASIVAAAEVARTSLRSVDLVLVATGRLHDGPRLQPEKSWRALEAAALTELFQINAIGPALVAKHFLPLLPRERKAVFAAISARVSSIEDNQLGGWYGYRASKAALNMLLRTLALELARRWPAALCVGLHPGTVATELSGPFRTNVPAERLFTPDFAARRLLAVLEQLTPADSGRLFAWDGQRIPF